MFLSLKSMNIYLGENKNNKLGLDPASRGSDSRFYPHCRPAVLFLEPDSIHFTPALSLLLSVTPSLICLTSLLVVSLIFIPRGLASLITQYFSSQ